MRVEQGDLRVRGQSVADYPVAAFSYDAETLTATWRLGRAIPFDRVRLELRSGDEGVEATEGEADLDGEWPGGAMNPAGPTGNGQPGGDLVLTVPVTPGDVDRSGRANALDVAAVRAALGARPTWGPGRYSIFADLDADGRIDALDLAVVRRSILTQPPA